METLASLTISAKPTTIIAFCQYPRKYPATNRMLQSFPPHCPHAIA